MYYGLEPSSVPRNSAEKDWERERRERNILAVRKIMAEKVGARSKKDSHSLVRMNIQGFSGVQCSPVHSTGTNIVGPDSHWTGPFFNFFFPLCIFFHEQESSACSRTSSPPTFRHRFRGKGFTTTARLCLAECGTILSWDFLNPRRNHESFLCDFKRGNVIWNVSISIERREKNKGAIIIVVLREWNLWRAF